MAESTLSLHYTSLMNAVGFFLYGREQAELTTEENARVDDFVQIGYRQFLYPSAFEGIPPGYEWTFMRPVTTIVTVSGAGDQDLPDDFGRLIDGFTFGDNAQVPPVAGDVGEWRIRLLRQQYDENGRPRLAGIRPKAGTGGDGQRQEIMWYPKPDAVYTLTYRYEAYVNHLSDDEPYPLGGMRHADTIRLACLAAAESTQNDEIGIHRESFQRALVASVARDKRQGAKYFGNVGASYEYETEVPEDYYDYTLTVSGEDIET